RGLVVRDVVANGPAADAGIARGDVIVGVADAPVRSMLDYARRMLTATPGSTMELTVAHGSARRRVQLHPATRQDFQLTAMTGFTVEQVSAEQDPDLVERATQAYYRGRTFGRVPILPSVLRVKSVQPDTPAQSLGLQRGDVILSVTGSGSR